MKRLHVLAGFLGCLAVLSAGLPGVALAWAPSVFSGMDHARHAQTTISAPCTEHCPSCKERPCPPTAAGCMVDCIGLAPSLITPIFALSMPDGHNVLWPVRLAELHGLVPPPDPSPPKR